MASVLARRSQRRPIFNNVLSIDEEKVPPIEVSAEIFELSSCLFLVVGLHHGHWDSSVINGLNRKPQVGLLSR
ncbi:hypothetical protein BQ8482_150012 [Mesorhizobium delmotii]|uniref:Uncharacterized protein n=1 Tax=Mesorhizobium delmotii TaxID=1631247 RepID=A0A2P9AH33_9HYPH|nr:hypothetical protein BQ8482_150012 [Mesorhizobium delmotii]